MIRIISAMITLIAAQGPHHEDWCAKAYQELSRRAPSVADDISRQYQEHTGEVWGEEEKKKFIKKTIEQEMQWIGCK